MELKLQSGLTSEHEIVSTRRVLSLPFFLGSDGAGVRVLGQGFIGLALGFGQQVCPGLLHGLGIGGAQIDEQNRTCLHLYSHHEEIQAVNWLLDAGASVHARTKDGRTPLHLAADRNNNMMVCALSLAHGANSEAIDTIGKRPVDYARENHKTKIIALLDRQ